MKSRKGIAGKPTDQYPRQNGSAARDELPYLNLICLTRKCGMPGLSFKYTFRSL